MNDFIVDGPQTATVIASVTGWPGATANVTVLDNGQSGSSAAPETAVPLSLVHSSTEDGLHLTWPVSAFSYTLEVSAALGASAVWTPVSAPVALEGDSFVVELPMESASQFYRLRRSGP